MYDSKFSMQGDILRVEVGGRYDAQACRAFSNAVRQKLKDVGANHVLIVSKLKGRVSAADRFNSGSSLHKLEWPRGARIAIVLDDSDDLEGAQFGALVAQNRGYSVEAFAEHNKAVNWLAA